VTLMRIGHKLALTSAVVVVLAMSVFWLVTNSTTESILRQQADSLGESIARQTAILVTELVLSNDLISMNVVLNQLTRDAAISQAAILNVDDQVIAIAGAQRGAAIDRDQIFGSYVSPISLQGSLAGYVRINLDQSYIERGVTRNFTFMLIALGLLVLVAISVTTALAQHYISFPLHTLLLRLQQLRHGEIELCPFAERNDEIGLLIQEYNRLAYMLERGAQGRPVLPQEGFAALAEDDEEDTEPSGVTMGSVLHIQISNYQSLLQGERRASVSRLNACYFYATQVAELYNGNIEVCAEDTLLISFGARQMDDEHAFHGCCSALLFLLLMQRVNQLARSNGMPRIECQAGLHSGELLTGVLSPLGRNRYTIAGESLNIVRKIAHNGAPGALIVSEQALIHAGGDARMISEQYSEFFDAAQDHLVATYLIRQPAPGLKALLDSQAEHLLSLPASA
jgi:uncharacterized membrane protein affecting hemolysin expression